MKKRILSAALALAMALTLLPVSVFAADPTPGDNGTSIAYYEAGKVATDADGTLNTTAGWYYKTGNKTTEGKKDIYDSKDSGVVAGSKYYSTGDAALEAKASSVKVIGGSITFDLTKATGSTLSIDINECDVEINADTLSNHKDASSKTALTSLTVTNSGADTAKVGGSIKAEKQNFTFTGSNFADDSLAFEVDNTGNTTGTTLTVKLTNATVSDITATNAKVSVEAKAKSKTGAITTAATSSGGANSFTGGKVDLDGRSETGKVTMNGAGTVSLKGMSQITAIDLYGGKKGDNASSPTAIPSWKTTVTVDGTSTVGPITQLDDDQNGHKIDVKGGSVVGNINMSKGGSSDIDFNSSAKTTAPTVQIARGTVDIKNSAVGNITAGSTEESGAVTVTVGTKGAADTSKVGNVLKLTDAKSTPAVVVYGGTVGNISAATHEVWGGTIGSKVEKANLKGGLEKGYQIEEGDADKTYTYTTSFQDLIDKYAEDDFTASRVGDPLTTGSTGVVSFQWNTANNATAKVLTKLTITKGTYVALPSKVNETTVNYWYNAAGDGLSPVDNPFLVTANTTTLAAQVSPKTDKVVTGVKAEDLFNSDAPIGATLKDKTINLSGAVNTTYTTGSVKVLFEVDGQYNETTPQSVTAGWDSVTGKVTLSGAAGEGVSIPTTQSNQVKVYDTIYTVTATGLKPIESKVKIGDLTGADRAIVVPNASAGMSGAYVELGKDVKESLEGSGDVNFSEAYDVQTALNAVIAGLSKSSVDSYVNQARSAMASYHNKKLVDDRKDWKAADFNDYDTLVLTPYLEISSSNPTTPGDGKNSILTLTITLKARYTVVQSGDNTKVAYKDKDAANNEIPWEAAVNLNSSGDCGQVDITLALPHTATGLTVSDGDAYVHHDGQVYKVTWADGVMTAPIENTNGFANKTFVINNTAGAFAVQDKGGAELATYDTLQDAVDAVKNTEKIVAGENFNGPITVSGAARKFTIAADTGKTVTITEVRGASTTFSFDASSNEYEIQLSADTAPVGGNITIASVTGGAAKVSANPAKAGDTVTIALTPAPGYVSNGVSVKTSAGTAVKVNGSGNSYTFVMPAASVTVTPSFALSDNKASISVNSNSSGTASVYTGTTDGRVEQGGTAIITMQPKAGYRTMDVTLRADNGKTVYSARQDKNSWSITVPSGATLVTVTPSFDLDNGTPFVDVKSTDWASPYVSWMYQKDYTTGKDTQYTFKPTDNVTRQEIVAFLWKANGSVSMKNSSYKNPFIDVYTSDWAYDAIVWAAANGLIDTSSRTFGKTVNASRAEVVTILYKYGGSQPASTKTGFIDVPASASYAKAVSWAEQQGITNGKDNRNTFKPNIAITRQEVSKMIYVAQNPTK